MQCFLPRTLVLPTPSASTDNVWHVVRTVEIVVGNCELAAGDYLSYRNNNILFLSKARTRAEEQLANLFFILRWVERAEYIYCVGCQS
jgi:hypothetical protein